MSIGQGARPIESADGTDATILSRGGETVILVRDPDARTLLNSLLVNQQEVLEAIQALESKSRKTTVVHIRPCNLSPRPPAAATVDTASVLAVAENLARRGLVLVNTSGNRISLGLGYAAVLDSGITIAAGGSWVMGVEDFVSGPIFAIASGATSNLAIQEFN